MRRAGCHQAKKDATSSTVGSKPEVLSGLHVSYAGTALIKAETSLVRFHGKRGVVGVLTKPNPKRGWICGDKRRLTCHRQRNNRRSGEVAVKYLLVVGAVGSEGLSAVLAKPDSVAPTSSGKGEVRSRDRLQPKQRCHNDHQRHGNATSRSTHDRIVGAGFFGPMLFGSVVPEPLWPELAEPSKAQGATGN